MARFAVKFFNQDEVGQRSNNFGSENVELEGEREKIKIIEKSEK